MTWESRIRRIKRIMARRPGTVRHPMRAKKARLLDIVSSGAHFQISKTSTDRVYEESFYHIHKDDPAIDPSVSAH